MRLDSYRWSSRLAGAAGHAISDSSATILIALEFTGGR
jgi:hypothetical protein